MVAVVAPPSTLNQVLICSFTFFVLFIGDSLTVVLISYDVSFSVGKTYRLRISNVGLQNSLNFQIQNHMMKLVEVEGTHTIQTPFSTLDVHVGQSYSVLITADQPAKDYYIVVSSRFTSKILITTGVLHYSNSAGPVSGPIPDGPTQLDWSFDQARAIKYCFILSLTITIF